MERSEMPMSTALTSCIIGDVPIYVAMDSADVWAERAMFQLDSHGFPTEVAGVPPDYFALTDSSGEILCTITRP